MSFSHSKKKRITACLLCLLTAGRQLYAQSYTLPALIDSAAVHLPAILEKQALAASAEAAIATARHTALPSLELKDQVSLSTANSVNGSFFPFGISTSGSIRSQNNLDAATGNIAMLYTQYELVNFGLNQARTNRAVRNATLSKSDLVKELYVLKMRISKVYFTLLQFMYQLAADEQNIHRYQAIFTVIKAVTESGIQPGVDSSLALAELSKAQVSYNRRSGEIYQLQQQLAFLTGSAVPVAPDTSRALYALPKDSLVYPAADSTSNPLLAYYREQQNLLAANSDLIKKSYRPKILLAGGFWGRGSSIDYQGRYKALGNGLGYQRYNYAVGLAFVYDLFNGIHKRDRLAENRFNRQASDYALQQQQLALLTAKQQAENALQTARQNLQQLPTQLQAAKDAFEQKLAQYKAGVINLVDLTNTSYVLYRAQTDYIETLNDWMQANLDKAAATGNLDQFIQSIKN